MPIRSITAEQGLRPQRGSVVVCLLAGEENEPGHLDVQALGTALSVIAHTDSSTSLLIVGPGADNDRIARELSDHLPGRTLTSLALDERATVTDAVNAAARASYPGDLVLVTPGVHVTEGWLERLTAAATSDSTVASATPVSLSDGALSLFEDVELERDADELASRLAERGARLRPRIAIVGTACAYVRRAALELVGPLDERLELEAALADFALRVIAAGMVHVAADDALVIDAGGRSASAEDPALGSPVPLTSRVRETFDCDEQGRLRRAIAIGRVALRRLSVTIDGRALVPAVGGTQTYILELILALARAQRVELRVLVPPDLSERASAALRSFADVELLSYEQAVDHPRLTDVVHRPQPIFTADDLALLRLVGERVVVGQQDLIAYHNYSYHRDIDSWRAYRRTTRLALGAADQVIFFSEHARGDALGEDLLPERRTHVVGVGADSIELTSSPGTPPAGLHEDEPFLLCLGADYAHKNRPFAIALVASLRELGWSGRLVLAGAHVPFGSSREHERALLDGDPEIDRQVIDLGPVDEPVKQWLFRHARALAYPTIYEGLGLLPLEAARMDLPCLFAAQASLSELAGPAATLVAWDADASATAVLPLLQEGSAREGHLADLRSLPVPSWDAVAGQLVAVYERAVYEPPPEAAPRGWQELDREAYIARLERQVDHHTGVAQEYQDAYHALEGRVGDALPLVDEDGLLSTAQQRGLMRIAARRGLGALMLAPFGLVGRVQAAAGDESSRDAPGA